MFKDPSQEKSEIQVDPLSNEEVIETTHVSAETSGVSASSNKRSTTHKFLMQARDRHSLIIVSHERSVNQQALPILANIALAVCLSGYYSFFKILKEATLADPLPLIVTGAFLLIPCCIALKLFIDVLYKKGVIFDRNDNRYTRWKSLGPFFMPDLSIPIPESRTLTVRQSASIDGSQIYYLKLKHDRLSLYETRERAEAFATAKKIARYLALEIEDVTETAGVKVIRPDQALPQQSRTVNKSSTKQQSAGTSLAQSAETQLHQTPVHTIGSAKHDPDVHNISIAGPTSLKDDGDSPNKPIAASTRIQSQEQLKVKDQFAHADATMPSKYVVLGMLGEGGMATVFKVKDSTSGKLYAAKILTPQLVQDSEALRRLEQEARAAESLKHQLIAAIHEFGVGNNGVPYLIMDYVPGKNLAELLRTKHRLPPQRALPLFIQITDAVSYAHGKGVVHRDLKPSNIMIDTGIHQESDAKVQPAQNQDKLVETAKLVDFGIAKMLENQETESHGLTKTGEIFGTPLYMSPEQCEGTDLDARSDIYSLGCVMYEVLSGRPPFESENPVELILKHLEDEPPNFDKLVQDQTHLAGISEEDLEYIIFKCLRKEPADRYQTMQDLKTELIDCVNGVPINHDAFENRKQKKGDHATLIAEQICEVCGKPVAGVQRTDVTRYLTWESRCQCIHSNTLESGALENAKTLLSLSPTQFANAAANLPEQYEIVSIIGRGGMGAVFKVREKNSDKIFAVKMLQPQLASDNTAIARFKNEARTVSSLTHAGLVTVYDYGIGRAGAPYLVMDYLIGKTLEETIHNERVISVPRGVDLFIQMAESLEYAHEHHIVHRDLKPSNVMVQTNGEGVEIAKLLDFGIAKNLAGGANRNTKTGDVLGSPMYMSPEQCIGKKLDARSDIYSFGCLMYEALSGHPPFSGKNQVITIVRHIKELPESLCLASKAQPIDDDLDYIVMRCLRKEPGDRYQHASDLLRDLKAFSEHKQIKHVQPRKSLVRFIRNWKFWRFQH